MGDNWNKQNFIDECFVAMFGMPKEEYYQKNPSAKTRIAEIAALCEKARQMPTSENPMEWLAQEILKLAP